MLQHEAPLEYKLVTESISGNPTPEFIEGIAYASGVDLFHKQKFWVALKNYRKYGLYPLKPMRTNVKRELFYIRYRRNNSIVKSY